LSFPEALLRRARSQGIEAELEEQRAEFASRLERHRSELATIGQRIRAVEEEIEGQEIQRSSEQKTLEILREELADKKTLLDQGLTQRGGYNALRRAETETLGSIGSLTAAIGQKRAVIAELEDQRSTLRAKRQETAATQINELRSKVSDLREQLLARTDTLTRSDIRSPARGVIVALNANTIGSTIQPGEALVEILPTNSELIVEARVMPQDADAIRVGQNARVRLTGLNTRTTPELPAKVIYLSADRIVDAKSQESFYTARLAFESDLPDGIGREQIFPGRPADVLISTGDRTFLEYLLRPLQDSLSRAFREE
ncbi:MAG: HlyD family type I secretion periplasmic adaptor subunit, partial [Pseudomonadota bacterium]|nr:HlyD family type I secretion periplasmic adaptor subunit [Pseudomonadota bacterium]